MLFIHPVSGTFFFPLFGSSHGCYSSILLAKTFFPPLLFFIVPMDVVHPICKEINSLFWYTGTDYLLYPLDVILFVAQNFLFNNIKINALLVSANCKKQPKTLCAKTRTFCCYQILRIWLVGDLNYLFIYLFYFLLSQIYTHF